MRQERRKKKNCWKNMRIWYHRNKRNIVLWLEARVNISNDSGRTNIN